MRSVQVEQLVNDAFDALVRERIAAQVRRSLIAARVLASAAQLVPPPACRPGC
jgi:hypothetical protein